jgi:hypothetical protein
MPPVVVLKVGTKESASHVNARLNLAGIVVANKGAAGNRVIAKGLDPFSIALETVRNLIQIVRLEKLGKLFLKLLDAFFGRSVIETSETREIGSNL